MTNDVPDESPRPAADGTPSAPSPSPADPADPRSGREADVQVLYLAGKGRSGSTLLCRTLGDVPGFVAVGELMRIFGRGVTNGDLCSCGTPVPRCPLWSDVLDELRRAAPDFDPEHMERLRDRVTEGGDLSRYFFLPGRFPALERRLERYRRVLSGLYRAIREVSGCSVIVDSSKNAAYGRLLSETEGVSLSVVHLVRDSRGVAHSLSKMKRRPGTNGRREFFERRGPLGASTLWTAAQLMTESLRDRAARFTTVRYEDFVHAPRTTVEQILALLGASNGSGELAHVDDTGAVRLGEHHLIASNPNRNERGEIELREDRTWQERMDPLRRGVVTLLTRPLLKRYGYLDGDGRGDPTRSAAGDG